jgi:hypothetical protein
MCRGRPRRTEDAPFPVRLWASYSLRRRPMPSRACGAFSGASPATVAAPPMSRAHPDTGLRSRDQNPLPGPRTLSQVRRGAHGEQARRYRHMLLMRWGRPRPPAPGGAPYRGAKGGSRCPACGGRGKQGCPATRRHAAAAVARARSARAESWPCGFPPAPCRALGYGLRPRHGRATAAPETTC